MPRVAAPPDVREAVLDAAIRLIERSGYKKMTMEDIAHEAHIGKATIYGYFNNKEDLALSVMDYHYRRLQEQWREIIAEEDIPEARLRRMLLALVLSSFDRAQRCRQSIDETLAALRHVIFRQREKNSAELAQLLGVVLQEGCEQGRFTCSDVPIAAYALLTCVNGLSPSNLSARELGERDEIVARTNQVIDLVLIGLYARSTQSP
jgi:AcrR family transcriptional regulator